MHQSREELVGWAVSYYRRRCHVTDTEDLTQAAWEALLEATLRHDPTRGPLAAYAVRPVCIRLRAELYKSRSPVSEKQRHLSDLVGTCAVSLDGGPDEAGEDDRRAHRQIEHRLATETPMSTPEDNATRAELIERVRAAVERLAGGIRDGRLGAQVLLTASAPYDVAAEAAVPVARVYRATKILRRRIREDDELRALGGAA